MATENIKKRSQNEQQDLEQGFEKSISEVEQNGKPQTITHDKVTIKETEDNKVVLVYNGKEFTFPKAQPAWVSLFVAHHGKGPEKELSDEKTLDFLAKLIGSDLVEEIIEVADNDFSIADVGEQIVTPIQSYWSKIPEGDDKKKQTSTSGS